MKDTKDTKAHEEGALGFNPLCNFVSFVVDEIRTLLADVGADTLVGRFSASAAENSVRSTHYRTVSPYFCVEGGTIPFILKYSTICP